MFLSEVNVIVTTCSRAVPLFIDIYIARISFLNDKSKPLGLIFNTRMVMILFEWTNVRNLFAVVNEKSGLSATFSPSRSYDSQLNKLADGAQTPTKEDMK